MSRPVLLKLGGSVITDKTKDNTFRRAVTRRLLAELQKAAVPCVLLHGAGSFGHPPAKRWRLADGPIGPDARAGVSETLARVAMLHAEILNLAVDVGLRPVSVPVHLSAQSRGGVLEGLPMGRILQLLEEGYVPVLHGTMVRDDINVWRIVSADELMAELAPDLEPRLAVFLTDVDGVYAGDPAAGGDPVAQLGEVADLVDAGGSGDDVTGRMIAKVRRGLEIAEVSPTLVLNGTVRGRLLDALRGKPVVGTRLVH